MKYLVAMPLFLSSFAASANQQITEDTGVSLGLLLSGVAGSIALTWWAARDRAAVQDRLSRIERTLKALAAKHGEKPEELP